MAQNKSSQWDSTGVIRSISIRSKMWKRLDKGIRRKRRIHVSKQAILWEKLEKAEKARIRQAEETMQQTDDVLFWGLWQTIDQVDVMLNKMINDKKIKALKAQLRFRKNILKQTQSNNTLQKFFKGYWQEKKTSAGDRVGRKC